jgi:hypothetical protein
MRIALLMLAACGSQPVPAILPPNTVQSCERAIRCGVFLREQQAECTACLEHIDPNVMASLRAQYGDLPPLDSVDCDTITTVCQTATNISACVVGRWYGP